MIKILIADDHRIFRRGLKQSIEDTPGMAVISEAGTGREVLARVAEKKHDVLIIDISMPGPTVFELMERLKSDYPGQKVLVLSVHSEDQYAIRVLKAGAFGYLTKDTDEAVLIKAIKKVAAGGKYVSPCLAEKLAAALDADYDKSPHEMLSEREYQVMLMIAGGESVSEIARDINLSVSTISTYRFRILEKTGLKNNAEIVHYAMTHQLID